MRISAGALLVLAVLFYLDREQTLRLFVPACVFHELGHWVAVRLLGGSVREVRISCVGAELRLGHREGASPLKMFCIALAGPLSSLVLFGVSKGAAERWLGPRGYVFSAINLGLACFNLLPLEPLDGGRALRELVCLLADPMTAETVTRLVGRMVLVPLLWFGLLLWRESGGQNFTLLFVGAWAAYTVYATHGGRRS